MSLDHPTEERLLHDLRGYFGYADDQVEFIWSDTEGVHEVALFTYNPRHTHRFLFHKSSGSTRIQALQSLLDYIQTHRDRELSYTIQWRVAGELEFHTSYFSAGNILMALDKFFAGRDPHTVQVFSVMLNPMS
ncbi:hypothetical protein OAO65_04095 [Flavobacteriales bacterium]|jgi:hypothetical protein|nr:hypothetical protein [Flavobacteriales bacterium]